MGFPTTQSTMEHYHNLARGTYLNRVVKLIPLNPYSSLFTKFLFLTSENSKIVFPLPNRVGGCEILNLLVPVNFKRKSKQTSFKFHLPEWEIFRQISGGKKLLKTNAVEDFDHLKVISGKMPRSSLTSIRSRGRTSPVSNVS